VAGLRDVARTQGLAYTDTGRGQPVVLLHGLTCHAGYWLRVAPLLDGLRVVSVDLRGHGLSAHRESYRYVDYEDDLLALLDELRLDGVVVAGHSLGGYVALSAATRDGRIGGVLAVDVKSDWTTDDAALAERSRGATRRVEPDRETVLARLARSLAPVSLEPDELERLAVRGIEEADGGWRLRWDRAVLATEPVDPFAFLSRVRCRVHVMAGSESEVMPPDAANRFSEAIPEATLELVEGVGHHVELEAPRLAAARIRELAA
jgi:pimeloyl-ACP methyl ester carboxylesterase